MHLCFSDRRIFYAAALLIESSACMRLRAVLTDPGKFVFLLQTPLDIAIQNDALHNVARPTFFFNFRDATRVHLDRLLLFQFYLNIWALLVNS